MPTITYNGQSFSIDGRRIWILAASLQYARIPPELWADRIAAARQAGFNTIETACPWVVHEPRKGRFHFKDGADLRRFVQLCGEAGMMVVLRVGPFVGELFDGGGIPGWLVESPGVSLREANSIFLEHVSRHFRRLLGEVANLQATGGGPIILIQSEHAWTCSHEKQAARYLDEITRYIREAGIQVPIINGNDLWQEARGTIDTWRGYDDLLTHLRQLRTVQPDAPRIVSTFDPAEVEVWGDPGPDRRPLRDVHRGKTPHEVMSRLAQVLAAGAQPFVSPFHSGTSFGFLGGRITGRPDGFVTSRLTQGTPLGEAGERGETYHAIRRLITFANSFGHVFAELDPDYHPAVIEPSYTDPPKADAPGRDSARRSSSGRGNRPITSSATVIPLRGPQGRIVFVIAPRAGMSVWLILDSGLRLPVHLGDQPVGWCALDVDLQGAGRLEYANIFPWAVVDRSIVVFFGAARSPVFLSINETPLEATVPAEGQIPLALEHAGLTIVICNQPQIDQTYTDGRSVYVGILGFDRHGDPVKPRQRSTAWRIQSGSRLEVLPTGPAKRQVGPTARAAARRNGIAPRLGPWQAIILNPHVTGASPRFASLDGPETLSECGATTGYGWYRFTVSTTRKRLCYLPHAADRIHLFVNGKRHRLFGVGPGADLRPFQLKRSSEPQTVVALVDNFGRFCDGNDLAEKKGLWGHLYEVRPMRAVRPKIAVGKPADPFELRGFIASRAAGQRGDLQQVFWRFTHRRQNPILIVVSGAEASGTFVLNDVPVAYYAGATGGCVDRIMLDPRSLEAFRRGANVVRFLPDPGQPGAVKEIKAMTVLYECEENLTESAPWAFAKWEPPPVAEYADPSKAELHAARHVPTWWRTIFELAPSMDGDQEPALRFDTSGLSKGQVFVNGRNLGRYFTALPRRGSRLVGPQTRLYLPEPWLRPGETNELVIFDEYGFHPGRTRLIRSADR